MTLTPEELGQHFPKASPDERTQILGTLESLADLFLESMGRAV